MSSPGRSPAPWDRVIVANRLPVEPVPGSPDAWRSAPGGVVSALRSTALADSCTWVGYAQGQVPARAGSIQLEAVGIDSATYQSSYDGLCNSTLWPLYHDALRLTTFDQAEFRAYERVNLAFAERVAEVASVGASVWIHDYQLQLVPLLLREKRPDLRIGFFLHTPFPVPEVFARLPWREHILSGILGADLVGLQTPGDARRFREACVRMSGHETANGAVHLRDRRVAIDSFPVGVDASALAAAASTPLARARAGALRQEWGSPRTVLLGVDRLDYTKGIPQRLRAYADALSRGDLDARESVFVQVATPTRGTVADYQEEAAEVARLVDGINERYPSAPVIYYVNRALALDDLVAHYLAADVLVCSPFRDGMNLVAKEFVACRTDGTGAIVLSEFAGAAQQLSRAWLVNPFDLDDLRRALVEAALSPAAEARARMLEMRRSVQEEDVHAWATAFLRALESIHVMRG